MSWVINVPVLFWKERGKQSVVLMKIYGLIFVTEYVC